MGTAAAKKEILPEIQPDITIEAWKVRAAMRFQATWDVRYYLHGICHTSDGRIAATDGHTLFVCPVEDPPKQDYIVNLKGAFPKSSKAITLKFVDEKQGIARAYNSKGREVKVLAFDIIDGKFPDFDRVIPEGPPRPEEGIPSFNASYLARCASALDVSKTCQVKVYFRGKTSAIEVRAVHQEYSEAIMIIMPMRE